MHKYRETTEEQNFSHSRKSSNGGIVTGLKSGKNRKARLAYHTMGTVTRGRGLYKP